MNKDQEHRDWLRNLVEKGLSTQRAVDKSLSVWTQLQSLFGPETQVPIACCGDSGTVTQIWEGEPIQLAAEVEPDGELTWVVMESKTGRIVGGGQ